MKPFSFRTLTALLLTSAVFIAGIAPTAAEGIGWRGDGTGYGNAAQVLASDRLYLRTEKHLMCIANP